MSAHFLFARFPAPTHRSAVDWLRAIDQVRLLLPERGFAPVLDPQYQGPVVGWRLLSDNNRELARSCALYPSEAAASHAATSLLRGAETLVVHPALEPRVRTTGWFAMAGDELVMMHARRYESRSVARNAGALAARLVVSASQAGPGEFGRRAPELTR